MAESMVERIQAAPPEERAYLGQFTAPRRRGRVPSVADALAFRTRTDPETGCVVWMGSKNRAGYGQVTIGKTRSFLVHRVSWELSAARKIPDGMVIDHLCRNTSCINPGHLRVVTPRENTLCGNAPSAIAAKRDVCPQGHPYRQRGSGRVCLACQRLATQAYRARRSTPNPPLPEPPRAGEGEL